MWVGRPTATDSHRYIHTYIGALPSLPPPPHPIPHNQPHDRERPPGHDGAGAEPTHGLFGRGLERGLLRCVFDERFCLFWYGFVLFLVVGVWGEYRGPCRFLLLHVGFSAKGWMGSQLRPTHRTQSTPLHTGFKVQPVHLGGMAEGEGLFMLHTYSDVPNAQQVCRCVRLI